MLRKQNCFFIRTIGRDGPSKSDAPVEISVAFRKPDMVSLHVRFFYFPIRFLPHLTAIRNHVNALITLGTKVKYRLSTDC